MTNKTKTMRGQAAMEYLMTYGWAILVIVIVLAVLMFLNPFKAPETCMFQQTGFDCSEAKPMVYTDSAGTHVSLQLFNKLGKSVKVHKVVCTNAAIGDVNSDMNGWVSPDEPQGTSVPVGGSYKFTEADSILCVSADGITPISLNPNADFKGVISVWYNFDNDPDMTIKRQASATLVTTVLKQ